MPIVVNMKNILYNLIKNFGNIFKLIFDEKEEDE